MENDNGYVIYPDSIGIMDLGKAKAYAAEQSLLAENEYRSRVEDCDTEKVMARFANGEEEVR